MKKIIILLIAVTTTFAGFAQKSKGHSHSGKEGTVVNKYTCPMHSDVTSNKPGKCSKCNMDLTLSKKEHMKEDVMKTYSCPMHPNVTNKKPGKCTECGTKLVVNRNGSKQRDMVTYTCPMHPDEKSETAGACPKCGMDMVQKKNKKN